MDINGDTPLNMECEKWVIETVTLLLKNGTNPKICNVINGCFNNLITPFHIASKDGLVCYISLQLEMNADPNIYDNNISPNIWRYS